MRHKKYCMIFDMGHTIDGIEFDDLEDAKDDAVETLVFWITEEQSRWKFDKNGIPSLTEDQIESWDAMINDCCTYVVEWNEETGEWHDMDNAWFPSYETDNEIGWMEWEELKKKYGW